MIHRTQSLRVINMLLGKTQCVSTGSTNPHTLAAIIIRPNRARRRTYDVDDHDLMGELAQASKARSTTPRTPRTPSGKRWKRPPGQHDARPRTPTTTPREPDDGACRHRQPGLPA